MRSLFDALRVSCSCDYMHVARSLLSACLDLSAQASGSKVNLSGPSAVVAGFSARAVASVTVLPLTVVKTRFEAGER